MDCQRVVSDELAEKYVNGRLEAALQDEFEVHILECPKCLEEVEALNALRSVVTEQAHEIRLKQAPRRVFGFRWVPLLSAAIVCLVCATGVVHVLRRHQPETIVAHPVSAPAVQSPVEPTAQPAPEMPATSQNATAQESATVQPRVRKPGATSAPSVPLPEPEKPSATPPPIVVAQAPEQKPLAPAVQQPVRREHAGLTHEQGAELFRLGLVDPPAYTFAGFGSEGKASAAGATVKGYSTPGPPDSSRALFQNGMMAYVEGRYRDAAEKLEGAADAEPGAPDANFYLGICRLVQGHPAAAVQPLKKVIANGKSPLVQSAHFFLAKAYLQTSGFAAAEAELQASAAMPGGMKSQAATLLSRVQAFRAQLAK